MNRFVCIALVLILAALSLTACGPKENPPTVHVVHNGQLYEVESYPDETTANGLVYRRDELGDSLIEATIIPRKMALAMDLPYLSGFRFCSGILDMDSVSITTSVSMVRLDRSPALRTSDGKSPQKLVTNATAIAAIIMNALLVSRVTALMPAGCE